MEGAWQLYHPSHATTPKRLWPLSTNLVGRVFDSKCFARCKSVPSLRMRTTHFCCTSDDSTWPVDPKLGALGCRIHNLVAARLRHVQNTSGAVILHTKFVLNRPSRLRYIGVMNCASATHPPIHAPPLVSLPLNGVLFVSTWCRLPTRVVRFVQLF